MAKVAVASTPSLRLRFRPQHRLLASKDFRTTISNAAAIRRNMYFTVFARPNQLAHFRIGIAIAKRNVAKAVDRNRLKRRIREVFRLHQHRLRCNDIVVVVKRDFDQLTATQLKQQLLIGLYS